MPVEFIHLDSKESETTESLFFNQLIKARIKSENNSNQNYDPIFNENRSEEWNEIYWREILCRHHRRREQLVRAQVRYASKWRPNWLSFAPAGGFKCMLTVLSPGKCRKHRAKHEVAFTHPPSRHSPHHRHHRPDCCLL